MTTRYPRINRKPLDLISRVKFDRLKHAVALQLEFDNQQNDLGLSAKDLELLSWNLATVLLWKEAEAA